MSDQPKIVVRFEGDDAPHGFRSGANYSVIKIQSQQLLLVDEHARMTWVANDLPTVVSIDQDGHRLFDIESHRFQQRLNALVGRPVRITTWENIGFDPDETTNENMSLYRGVVENFDGQTLFLRRPDSTERFGILPAAIATLDEEK